MASYLSLLRGINVGGHRKIKMADLKEMYESLGFGQVTTYIQSANVVFSSTGNESTAVLSTCISNAIEERFGFEAAVIIRTKEEIQQTVMHNPFTGEALTAPDKLVVMFSDSGINESVIGNTKAKTDTNICFECLGNTIYCFYPLGYGQTKWNSNFFEKQLKTAITARNWATTCKLAELLSILN